MLKARYSLRLFRAARDKSKTVSESYTISKRKNPMQVLYDKADASSGALQMQVEQLKLIIKEQATHIKLLETQLKKLQD